MTDRNDNGFGSGFQTTRSNAFPSNNKVCSSRQVCATQQGIITKVAASLLYMYIMYIHDRVSECNNIYIYT